MSLSGNSLKRKTGDVFDEGPSVCSGGHGPRAPARPGRDLLCCGRSCGAPPRFSRFTRATLDWADPWEQVEELIEPLVRFAEAQPEPPVLFYEADRELLLISRHRERLGKAFRFVVPNASLVEGLVDKARFQVLAENLSLPVPKARRLLPVEDISEADLDLRFPFIIKPPDATVPSMATVRRRRQGAPGQHLGRVAPALTGICSSPDGGAGARAHSRTGNVH